MWNAALLRSPAGVLRTCVRNTILDDRTRGPQQRNVNRELLHRDRRREQRLLLRISAAAATDAPSYVTQSGLPDYYEILGVDDDSSYAEIKAAYRGMAMTCHPDIAGDNGHNICILLNEAYSVLSKPEEREAYNFKLEQALRDEDDDFTGEPLSHWCANKPMGKNENPWESRAVFVDECACIGCKQCVWLAQGTFRIEPDHGRSRAFAQWVDVEDNIQAAIDSCPVECIHWVQKAQLPALEYVMQRKITARPNASLTMNGQGLPVPDVFSASVTYLKKRNEKEAAEELRKNRSWWDRFSTSFGLGNLREMAASHVTSSEGDVHVGNRKRRRNPMDGDLSDGNGTIPLERSMVLSSSDSYSSDSE